MITDRQSKALEIIAENVRENKTLPKGEILRRAGYAESTCLHPDKVYDSDGFKELLNTICPRSVRANIMAQGMRAKKRNYYKDDMGKLKWEHEPDWAARSKFIDMANKINGDYASPDIEVNNITLTQILQEKGL